MSSLLSRGWISFEFYESFMLTITFTFYIQSLFHVRYFTFRITMASDNPIKCKLICDFNDNIFSLFETVNDLSRTHKLEFKKERFLIDRTWRIYRACNVKKKVTEIGLRTTLCVRFLYKNWMNSISRTRRIYFRLDIRILLRQVINQAIFHSIQSISKCSSIFWSVELVSIQSTKLHCRKLVSPYSKQYVRQLTIHVLILILLLN